MPPHTLAHRPGAPSPQRRQTSVPVVGEPDRGLAPLAALRATGTTGRRAGGPDPACCARRRRSGRRGGGGDQRRRDERRAATARRGCGRRSRRSANRPARRRSTGARSAPAHSGEPDRRSGTATPAAPARRPAGPARRRRRARATSGLRSSCSASSCSSTTTIAARSGHGAHTAVRAPITTSTPPAAAAHSSRHVRRPSGRPAAGGSRRAGPVGRRASRRASARAGRRGEHRHDVVARRQPQHTAAVRQQVARRRDGPARTGSRDRARRRRSRGDIGGWTGARRGTAAAGRRPSAPMPSAASSMMSAAGPHRTDLGDRPRAGRRRTISSRGPSATTQPPTRRPCERDANDVDPTRRRRHARGRGSRTACRAR